MSSHSTTITIEEFEHGEQLLTLLLEVEYSLGKSYPGSRDNPPEPAEIEELTATVVDIHDEEDESVSSETWESVKAEVKKLVEDGGSFYETLANRCYEKADEYESEDDGPDPYDEWCDREEMADY